MCAINTRSASNRSTSSEISLKVGTSFTKLLLIQVSSNMGKEISFFGLTKVSYCSIISSPLWLIIVISISRVPHAFPPVFRYIIWHIPSFSLLFIFKIILFYFSALETHFASRKIDFMFLWIRQSLDAAILYLLNVPSCCNQFELSSKSLFHFKSNSDYFSFTFQSIFSC